MDTQVRGLTTMDMFVDTDTSGTKIVISFWKETKMHKYKPYIIKEYDFQRWIIKRLFTIYFLFQFWNKIKQFGY